MAQKLQKSKWVKLTALYQVEQGGKLVTKHPGDWVKVGWQEAQMMIAKNQAVLPGQDAIKEFVGGGDVGILVMGSANAAAPMLEDLKDKVGIKYNDAPMLPWAKTIVWNPLTRLRVELIPSGLGLLGTWEVAMPLYDKYVTATQEGTTEDRERTAKIIRDLRVPMYDTRLIYARNCDGTMRLFEQWRAERKDGGNDRLAFLRAFYQVKPYMLALPITWTGQHINDDR